MTTFDRLCAILVKDYQVAPAALVPDASLEALGIDSLGVAELLFTVEDAFAVRLPPEPVTLKTLGEVAAFIDALIAAQSADAGAPPGTAARETALQGGSSQGNLSPAQAQAHPETAAPAEARPAPAPAAPGAPPLPTATPP